MDPFTLLMAAQGLVAGIRQGCEFLAQGKAEINNFKSTLEKGVGDARAIYKEITGIWGWLKSLFGGKPSKPATISPIKTAEPETAKPSAKKESPSRELSYEEFQAQAIHQICEQLKSFFEIKRQLAEHCRQLEEESKTTTDIEGAALDRIQIEMQMEAMTVQIREAMIYTPKDIGLQSIYSRFLKMYDQILEERAFDRQLKAKQARDLKWQQEYRSQILRAKVGYAIVMAMAVLWMTGLYSLL